MENAQTRLLRAGGKDQLIADFTALCETTTMDGQSKYALRPTLETLAAFLTAQGAGPNKDMALFELSHLIAGVGRLLGGDGLDAFFLQPERAMPSRFRHVLNGRSAAGVELHKECLRLNIGTKPFDIRFGRMPFLVALYEFLISMDSFAYYADFTALFADLIDAPIDDGKIRTCSNTLSSALRKYRIAYLSSSQGDGKFSQLYQFLRDQSVEGGPIILHDEAVFDFWCLHNQGKDYRGYRTVFDLFCDFAKAFEEARLAEASARAAPLGLNVEEGEIDIADTDADYSTASQWVSPFDTFDHSEFDDIRFFKKTSERAPVESLMAYGPDALRLPHAFLRYEVFGQVQSGITNDLQVGRGLESVQRRVACTDVQSYEIRLQECANILAHVKNLQAASLHVLGQKDDDTVVAFPPSAQEQAAQAFSKLKRKGFDGDAVQHLEAFELAAHALVAMQHQLERYMAKLETKQVVERFDDDRTKFKTQFETLYHEVLQ